MKTAELRKLSLEELLAKEKSLREEHFNLRFQHATAQLEKTALLPTTQKNIARVLTIIKEKRG